MDRVVKYINKTENLYDALFAYEKARGYDSDAEEEVIARCCESFLANRIFVQSFAKKNYKSAKAISEFLAQMNTDMRRVFDDAEFRATQKGIYNDMSPEQEILAQVADIDDIARLWSNAVNKVGKTVEAKNETKGNASAQKFSIKEIIGNKRSYGKGVVLDTDFFDGVSSRKWGDKLYRFVYDNLAGKQLQVTDENNNVETVYIARANDRVKKDGAKNSHLVLNELARVHGDNIKELATVHIVEVYETSSFFDTSDNHNHQWLDQFGWTYRKAILQDRKGRIYEVTLNIAKGREREILYSLSNIRQIDTTKASGGVVPSTVFGRGSHTSRGSKGILPSKMDSVKSQVAEGQVRKGYREIQNAGNCSIECNNLVNSIDERAKNG